ncbi:MAG: hydroxyacid dehydrogenase [Deltaproteobacteria bacterium]|jgi:phosphoglycerate dehydrogenase-like enzyme|nr:hydroxyacid dehydrogenase [Deltaproteobacteria bacterium]
MLILISDAFAPNLPGQISRFGETTDDKSRLKDADVVLIRSKTKCTKEYIDQAPNLKMIIRGGVGLDNVDQVYAKEKGIAVYNTAAASSIAVAEVAFALMLAVPNHLIAGNNGMAEGKWLKKELKRTELYGKTLGLIGMGLIATEVAKRATAFGMNVISYRKSGKPSEFAKVLPNLEDVLKESDYVSLHTPLTDETKGMFNKDTIAKMKDGAIIVNTGRGKCVVEEDIVAALDSGKLRGYATDVWYSDPPENSPITKAKNVVMLPHLGASSKENLLRIGDIIEEKLEEFVKTKA